jgi:hypothetical protein
MSTRCAICLEDITEDDDKRYLPCCHVFHTECAELLEKNSNLCPLCRTVISEETNNVDADVSDSSDTLHDSDSEYEDDIYERQFAYLHTIVDASDGLSDYDSSDSYFDSEDEKNEK